MDLDKNNYDPYIENLKKQIDYESDIFRLQ